MRFDWIPDRPDYRDHEFLPFIGRHALNASHTLDFSTIPVLNQGQEGSCTAHGTAAAVMFDQHAQGEPVVCPSRQFIYWNARDIEGTTDSDVGAQVRDAIKVVATLGAPPESDYPYDDTAWAAKPPAKAYADATRQEALEYAAVRYGHIRQTIQSGFPVVFGFTVFPSFESQEVASTGVVPMPGPDEDPIGGHCVIARGFDSRTRTIRFRNSWGGWGDGGDGYLPYEYFDQGLTSDYWVIRRLGSG